MKITLSGTDIDGNESKVLQAIGFVEARYGSSVIIGTKASLVKIGSPDSFFIGDDESSTPAYCGCEVKIQVNKSKPNLNDTSYSDSTLYVLSEEAAEQLIDSHLI